MDIGTGLVLVVHSVFGILASGRMVKTKLERVGRTLSFDRHGRIAVQSDLHDLILLAWNAGEDTRVDCDNVVLDFNRLQVRLA